MSNVKFRAWDIKESEMIYPDGVYGADYDPFPNTDIILQLLASAINGEWGGDELTEDFVLIQFMGIKDKNDVEIYEGDIISIMDYPDEEAADWEREDPRWETDYILKEVRKDIATMSHFPTCWLENETFGYEGENLVNPSLCEVIGNIHKNPELIKK